MMLMLFTLDGKKCLILYKISLRNSIRHFNLLKFNDLDSFRVGSFCSESFQSWRNRHLQVPPYSPSELDLF